MISLKRLMEEITARHTGQDIEKVAKDMDRDYYMTSQEAKEYGIIDTVVTSRDPARAEAAPRQVGGFEVQGEMTMTGSLHFSRSRESICRPFPVLVTS